MGHPLTAALWLKNDVARQGYRIKAGDLLSLGSVSAPVPAKDLDRVTATYRDLAAGPVEVHLGFSDGQ
jgi:2-keto-4-pentenoate hydratase